MESNKYTRLNKVCERYGLSPASVWRKQKNGTFPHAHKLSARISAWKDSELAEWEIDPMKYRAKS